MTRVITGLAAWLGGTALAVSLAWFGANMVVRDAGVSPGVQVINADPPAPAAESPAPPAPPTPPATPRVSRTPAPSHPARSTASGRPSPSKPPSKPPSPSATPTPTATATATGSVHSYTLAGGRVALLINGDSATLMTAVPDSGFSVMTWSGTDWLRVDFTSGAQVSSLIATWYEQTPTVTVTN